MFSIKLSEEEKKFAAVTLVAIVFFIFYQLFLVSQWDEVNLLKQKTQQMQIELRIAEQKAKLLAGLSQNLPALSRVKGLSEARSIKLLGRLSRAVASAKLNLSSIKPVATTGEDGIKYEIICSGDFNSFIRLFKVLKDNNILAVHDELNVEGGGVKSPKLKIRMLLVAYY